MGSEADSRTGVISLLFVLCSFFLARPLSIFSLIYLLVWLMHVKIDHGGRGFHGETLFFFLVIIVYYYYTWKV